ncbi:YoaK family protein [Actinoalloteichus fjordicus]|nr:YoaK family protein [Actinoalloteichus fjordicus]
MTSRTPDSRARTHLMLMLVLTFSTGVVDAVGYLGLDRVFVGNMTGNVVLLGMGVVDGVAGEGGVTVGGEPLPVLRPALALVGYLVGAVIAGRVLRRAAPGWTTHTTALLGVVAGVLLVLSGALLFTGAHPADPLGAVITTGTAVVMGIQAAAARRLAVKDVTTVVVTSTLTGLAADSRLAGGDGRLWARRVGAVGLILLGALVGAALLLWHIAAALLLSVVATVVVAVIGHRTREVVAEREPVVRTEASLG